MSNYEKTDYLVMLKDMKARFTLISVSSLETLSMNLELTPR